MWDQTQSHTSMLGPTSAVKTMHTSVAYFTHAVLTEARYGKIIAQCVKCLIHTFGIEEKSPVKMTKLSIFIPGNDRI